VTAQAGGRGSGTRVAAIDCGTNSLRLLVADVPPDGGPLVDVCRHVEIVRLGEGVDRTGRLAPVAIERTRVVLARYAEQIAELGADRVRMVATSASRDASNAEEFRAMVRATLGREPEVVTGEVEAGLSFAGAVRGLGGRHPGPYLAVDIGGGSTEFVRGGAAAVSAAAAAAAATTVDAAVSIDIGCVRMTERHLHSDPPTCAEIDAATGDITAAVDQALNTVDGRATVDGRVAAGGACAATVLGLSGSVTTVAAVALGLPAYDPDRIQGAELSIVDVSRVAGELLGMTRAQRRALPVMHPGRADIIGAGALILRVVLERCGATAVVASEHDILDGIAYSLLD
jgi:exopolyphosphatase/guanosine-5'-triphosphate,3'-diphosphate pyrophosphatase